jgi:hypothetical protein
MPGELATTQFNTYTPWFDKPVALRVAVTGLQTTINCTVVAETDVVLRVRLDGAWVVDIFKEMVLSIETNPYGSSPFLCDETSDELD